MSEHLKRELGVRNPVTLTVTTEKSLSFQLDARLVQQIVAEHVKKKMEPVLAKHFPGSYDLTIELDLSEVEIMVRVRSFTENTTDV